MNWIPTPKMQCSAVIGAMVAIMVWALRIAYSIEVPGEIASAATVLLSFVAGWFAPRSSAPIA